MEAVNNPFEFRTHILKSPEGEHTELIICGMIHLTIFREFYSDRRKELEEHMARGYGMIVEGVDNNLTEDDYNSLNTQERVMALLLQSALRFTSPTCQTKVGSSRASQVIEINYRKMPINRIDTDIISLTKHMVASGMLEFVSDQPVLTQLALLPLGASDTEMLKVLRTHSKFKNLPELLPFSTAASSVLHWRDQVIAQGIHEHWSQEKRNYIAHYGSGHLTGITEGLVGRGWRLEEIRTRNYDK